MQSDDGAGFHVQFDDWFAIIWFKNMVLDLHLVNFLQLHAIKQLFLIESPAQWYHEINCNQIRHQPYSENLETTKEVQ